MKTTPLILTCIAALAAACGPAKPPAGQTQYLDEPPAGFPLARGEAGPDDIGLFLAGKPVRYGAILSRLQQTVEYQEHQRELGSVWRQIARPRINRMKSWSDSELAAVSGNGTILYPFGGPDLLHVNAMFPLARRYALMGLEPVGEVPPLESMPPGEVLGALAAFRQATRTQLQAGYFITKDMRSDLERSVLRGVTPILLCSVALTGGQVESISNFSAGGNPGVELRFRDAAGMRHTAYYVAGDLSNSGFKGGYRDWVAGLRGDVSYFKAASYLMHDARFSQTRDFILSQSRAILQDDSGIPFRHFGQGWSFRYYGSYERPIELFAKHRQEDLAAAYAANPASPLGFGSGYHVNPWEANLLLAIKR
jgi:hypothetical protein